MTALTVRLPNSVHQMGLFYAQLNQIGELNEKEVEFARVAEIL